MGRNPSYVIEIETHLTDIKDEIKKYERDLQQLQKTANNMGFGDNISKDIQEAIDKLNKLQSEYVQSVEKFSKTKLDSSEFDKFSKSIDSRMSEISARITETEKTIMGLSQKLESFKGGDALQKQVENMRRQMNNFVKDIREGLSALKEFNSMVGSVKGSRNLKDELKSYEKLASIYDTMDFGSGRTTNTEKSLSKLEKRFISLYDKYSELQNQIDDTEEPKMIDSLQDEMANLLPELANVYNAIVKIKNIKIEDDVKFEKLNTTFGSIASELSDAAQTMEERIQSKLADIKSAIKSGADEINTATANMFEFKDGGIQVPVVLDKTILKSLKGEYIDLIAKLQAYADNNPVDVTMRLFPLNTTKAGQADVKEAVKNIQAQIADLPEGELKSSMNDLYNNLEKQYQKALKLKIAVELSEDANSVRANIQAIQDAIKEQNLAIYPEIVITDEVADKLSAKLKKLQEGFTFNLTDKITSMANSLKSLMDKGNSKEWVTGFVEGLSEIESKLETIKISLEPLTNLLGKKTKNNKNQPVNQQDIDIITSFTDAMNSLKESLNKQTDVSIDVELDPLIDKLDTIRATIGIVIAELGHLQSSLDAIKNINSLKLDENLMEKIQEGVNNSEPIRIPITPDLSTVKTFVSQIENAISNLGVRLNLDSSSIKKGSLQERLQNPDVANELYHQMYYGLDNVSGYLGEPLKKAIALALVSGLREGLSSTSDMIRNGLKGTKFESITDQIIGSEEDINNIKDIANNVVKAFENTTFDFQTDDFLSNIQEEITKSGKTIKIPISVLESSIDGFINEAQLIVNDKANIQSEATDQARQGLAETTEEIQKQETELGRLVQYWGNVNKIALRKGNVVNENAAYFNTSSGKVSSYVKGEPGHISQEIIDSAFNQAQIAVNGAIHTHGDWAKAAFSVGDLKTAYNDVLRGIKTQVLMTMDEVMTLDLNGVNGRDLADIIKEYEIRSKEAKQRLTQEGIDDIDILQQEFQKILAELFDTKNLSSHLRLESRQDWMKNNPALKGFKPTLLSNKTPVSSNINAGDKEKIDDSTNQITKESAKLTSEEAKAMADLFDKAIAATEAKDKFATANKEVLSSIIESLKGLNDEGKGFENLNKLINNLGGKSGDEKLQKTIDGLQEIYKVLNQNISENALVNALNELASKGTDLQNLATVLKASKKEITNAQKATESAQQGNLGTIMESVDISGNARNFLSNYGEVVNLTKEIKNGFIQITSTVLDANDTFKRYTLTTKDGYNMAIAKEEEHTAGLEKEVLLYTKLLRASNRLKALDEPSQNATGEVFIEKDSALWNQVLEYASEYGEKLGNILSVTRSVREANGEMLESFKIIGEKGSVTIGAENDVVGSVQNIQDVTKQYKELLNLRNKLNTIDLKNNEKETFTSDYISQVKEMVKLIDNAEFDLTNPTDVKRLEDMVEQANKLNLASKNLDNNLGNMKQLDKLRGKIADALNDYGAMPRKLKNEFKDLKGIVDYFIKAGTISAKQADEINAKFLELNANLSESGKKYQSMGRQLIERLRSQSSQLLAQYFSFQDILRYSRTAFETIRDLDTQLVDLRKTTAMNTSELNEFYSASSDVAKQLGVTTSEIIQQASSWSRLNKIGLLYGNI